MIREQNRLSFGTLMAITLLLVSAATLFFYHLGKTEFSSEGPARIAVYARQMIQEGTWLAPTLRGELRTDVPPLYLWAVRAVALFSEDLSAFESRLPGALSALFLVLLTAWWVFRHATRYSREDMIEAPPEGAALLAGLMLATSPWLFYLGRQGTFSSMFTFIYIAAAFCWGESLEARRSFYAGHSWRTWCFWGYLLAGLAMLVNGPLILPLLWVPYLLAARSYHLRKLDPIHLYGTVLALLIGLSWPVLVTVYHPAAAPALWHDWLTLRLGDAYHRLVMPHRYFAHVLLGGFPWIILAGVMTVRVWRRADRSPTLVFWMCSLLGNLLVLTPLSGYLGQYMLPVLVFVTLMASDGLYRWNFENRSSVVWRVIMRLSLLVAIALGVFVSLLLNSDLGLVLFLLLPVGWLLWVIYSRKQGYQFTPWETSMRLAALTVVIFFVIEVILLSYGEPRLVFHNDRLSYFHRVKDRMNDDDVPVALGDRNLSVLYDYYLGVRPVLEPGAGLSALHPTADLPAYAFVRYDRRDWAQWLKTPGVTPATYYYGDRQRSPLEAMLRLGPAGAAPAPTTATTATTRTLETVRSTLAAEPGTFNLLVFGNSGTRMQAQKRVAKKADQFSEMAPVDDAILLGNNLYGPRVLDHLAFVKAFEEPYRRLLKKGIVFHATLGHEDQSYAWLQGLYSPFHMNGERYYQQSLAGGLVDYFALDAVRFSNGRTVDPEQLAWLEKELSASRSKWKVVGLSRPLMTSAVDTRTTRVDDVLTSALLPLFDRYRVNVVAWSGGQFYERFALDGHQPAFFGTGWSGNKQQSTKFAAVPGVQKAYAKRAGFLALSFQPDRAIFQAITERGEVIDEGSLPAAGPVQQP